MPLPSDYTLPGADWLARRVTDLERHVRELLAGRRLEAARIGSGGVVIADGGSVTVLGGEIRVRDEADTQDLAVLSSEGIFIEGDQLILPGKVEWFAGPEANVPAGWLVCDGSTVSREEYPRLFAVIGDTWGPGDGSTTFDLPDLRGRFGIGTDGSTYPLGQTGGSSSHSHSNPSTGSAGSHNHSQGNTGSAGSHSHSNPSTGSAGSHNHGGATGTPSATVNRGDGGTLLDTPSQFHTHSIGSAGSHSHSQGDTGSADHLPPYAALVPIIRY